MNVRMWAVDHETESAEPFEGTLETAGRFLVVGLGDTEIRIGWKDIEKVHDDDKRIS